MSAADGLPTIGKATTSETPAGTTLKDQQKPPGPLEEDDEFEDFPVDDWPSSEQEVPPTTAAAAAPGEESAETGPGQHLWEESWDDDDASEEFSKQLKAELDKVKGGK